MNENHTNLLENPQNTGFSSSDALPSCQPEAEMLLVPIQKKETRVIGRGTAVVVVCFTKMKDNNSTQEGAAAAAVAAEKKEEEEEEKEIPADILEEKKKLEVSLRRRSYSAILGHLRSVQQRRVMA